jgi:hypothetical protein
MWGNGSQKGGQTKKGSEGTDLEIYQGSITGVAKSCRVWRHRLSRGSQSRQVFATEKGRWRNKPDPLRSLLVLRPETLPIANILNGHESIIALLALRFQARLPIILATNSLQTDYGISFFVPILQSKAQGG